MQKTILIKGEDKNTIYGTLDTPKKASKGLVIFAHGLTGNQNEHHILNGARYLNAKGYTTYRFDFYGGEKNERILENTSLKTYAKDLKSIITLFKKQGNKNIRLIGHSFGGLTILHTNMQDIQGVILRDSSMGNSLLEDVIYDKKMKKYILNRGTKFIVGKNLYKDACIPREKNIAKIKKIKVPIKIINAENSSLKTGGRQYFQAANEPKSFVIIPKAGHCFDEEGTEEKLFQETYQRIKKYT